MKNQVSALLAQLTLEEKASLCSGADNWHTKAIQRVGLPALMMADGPHGLRKEVPDEDSPGNMRNIQSVCFPAACASACSFDVDLLREMGTAIGEECQAEDVGILLGPGTNLKRSPLCGRNFEYFSEDPYLATNLAAAFIEGVQSQGVGTSLKHFAANNQETRRMSVSAQIDERTLRELYLASFEGAVKQAMPYSVMCSYNRINGVYSSENDWLLNQVLREDWGYTGFVVSDWSAVNDRVKGVAAGLDLEMPSSGGAFDAEIVQAVQEGRLDEAVVDKAAGRIIEAVLRWQQNKTGTPCNWQAHHQLAKKVATESMVLLKNDGALPLREGGNYVFFGQFANQPRYQGGGSSNITAQRVENALDAAKQYANVTWLPGWRTDRDEADQYLIAEALVAAKNADAVVVFAGLPDEYESEGYDRENLDMPPGQVALIQELAKVQPNLVVVLHNGSPVAMPWLAGANAVLEAYLGGQAVGGAVADVLFGRANPCGKLAESWPLALCHNPSYLNFPGEGDEVVYGEGVFIGYRYYDTKEMDVLFPFGHGLSYTNFAYEDIALSADEMDEADSLTVTVRLKNTGTRPGKEVVQLYVSDCASTVLRPQKELKGFAKIELQPGESGQLQFTLDRRAFAYWDSQVHDWQVESGDFQVLVGGSSRNLPLCAKLRVNGKKAAMPAFNLNSTIGDMLDDPIAKPMLQAIFDGLVKDLVRVDDARGVEHARMMMYVVHNMPLHGLTSYSKGKIGVRQVAALLEDINSAKTTQDE